MDTRKLEALAWFVREHGFDAIVADGAVIFAIPYTAEVSPGKWMLVGYESAKVHNMREARIALQLAEIES